MVPVWIRSMSAGESAWSFRNRILSQYVYARQRHRGFKLNGIRDRKLIDEEVEKSLQGAALWDEVKDNLQQPDRVFPADNSSACASRARWPSSLKSC